MKIRSVVLVTWICCVLSVANGATKSEWLSGWEARIPITIDNAQVDEDLTNFPVLVRLDASNFTFSAARADGYDVRFTGADGQTLLSYERERHDNAGAKAEYWVRLPLVSNTMDTLFYLYYGKSSAGDGQNATNVWDAGYLGVWHLNGTNAVTQYDSTVGANNLADHGAITEGVEGRIGMSVDLPGATNSSYIIGASRTFSLTNGITLSAWAVPRRGDDSQEHYGLIGLGGGAWWQYFATYLAHRPRVSSGDRSVFYATTGVWASDPDYPNGSGHDCWLLGSNTGLWAHVVMTCYYDPVASNSTFKAFLNGAKLDSITMNNLIVRPEMTRPVVLGALTGFSYPAVEPGGNFDGILDEVRMSNVARSEAWVKANYRNETVDSTFLTLDTTEYALKRGTIIGFR